MKILNFGSLNIDYVYSVSHFVEKGESNSPLIRWMCFREGKDLTSPLRSAEQGEMFIMQKSSGKTEGF